MSPTSSRNSVPPFASSKRPIFWAMAPGKRSLLVAEELAFQKARRNGGAVQLDEGARTTAAQVMDRARDQLFACARLSLDQNG